jgi:hypothetical protein
MNSGVISNRAGALLDIQSPGTYFDFDGPATLSRIENAGTLRLRPSTGFAQFNGVAFRNTGAFTVESGGASLGSFLQTAGSATVASVTFNADWIDLQGGVFSGSATILTTNFINGATLNPGASPGFITLNGPDQQTAAGTLNIELGGVLSGSQYDVLNIASTATLAGTLNISLLSGYQPALGAIFIPLSYTQRSGTFSTVTGTAVGNGVALDLDYEPTALVLQAESSTNTSTIQFAAGTPLPDGSMIITLTGTAGLTFTIESSTNFLSWTPVVGVTNAGLTYSFVLTNLTSRPYEFFRTRQ